MSQRMLGVVVAYAPLVLLITSGTARANALEDGKALINVFAAQHNAFPLTRWTAGSDPCVDRWQGVHCTGEQPDRVKAVALSIWTLKGGLNLTALQSLEELTDFELGGNALGGSIDLENLPEKITILDLAENQYTGPAHMTKLPESLLYLCLQKNKLTGSLDLTKLPASLKGAKLDTNEFTGMVTLTELPPALELLYLHSNRFQGSLDLTKLPANVIDFTAEGNSFSRVRFPSAVPSTMTKFLLKPVYGWGAPFCFEEAALDVSHLGAETDVPAVERQVLCPTPAPTPEPTTAAPTAAPTPEPTTGVDVTDKKPEDGLASRGNVPPTSHRGCVVGTIAVKVSCGILAVMVSALILSMITVAAILCWWRARRGVSNAARGEKSATADTSATAGQRQEEEEEEEGAAEIFPDIDFDLVSTSRTPARNPLSGLVVAAESDEREGGVSAEVSVEDLRSVVVGDGAGRAHSATRSEGSCESPQEPTQAADVHFPVPPSGRDGMLAQREMWYGSSPVQEDDDSLEDSEPVAQTAPPAPLLCDHGDTLNYGTYLPRQ